MPNLNDRQITNFAAYAQAGSMGREVKFLGIQDLIKADEKVLVLVPHGTPEELNSHSLQFWHLQDAIVSVAAQYYPDTADLKDPHYTLNDPTHEEFYKAGGFISQQIEAADIVLKLVTFSTWMVIKHPDIPADANYRYYLKFPEVSLTELLNNEPKEIWVYIDHRQVSTSVCENLYHEFCDNLARRNEKGVKFHLMSGHPSPEWRAEKEIILMATPIGFFVDKARGTHYANHLINREELIGRPSILNVNNHSV